MKAPATNATTTTRPITPQVQVGTPEDDSVSVVSEPSPTLVLSSALEYSTKSLDAVGAIFPTTSTGAIAKWTL